MTTTPTESTFRGDPALKANLVERMREHAAQDRLMKGLYFSDIEDAKPSDLKGCAVGCTVADILAEEAGLSLVQWSTQAGRAFDWHEEWARVTGLPEWLARVDDYLFEGLPSEASKAWPLRLLDAVPVGVDLDGARKAWLSELVFDRDHGSLEMAARAMESAGLAPEAARLRGVPIGDLSAAESAAASAESAARSAESAAWSARGAARSAESAAWSARNAARSARSAARSARSAAESAAASARGAAWSARSAAESAAWSARSAARNAAVQWIADRLIHHLTNA